MKKHSLLNSNFFTQRNKQPLDIQTLAEMEKITGFSEMVKIKVE